MTLPVPNLDDRRFQDLVDDAKRLVQQRLPEWTDHNVSDPGVTLIEAFAWMTDQLLYRLNRVPDRNYIKFLELIGVQLFPPTAARTPVTFWLSAPRPDDGDHPDRRRRSARRAPDTQEAIVFSTTEDLADRQREFLRVASRSAGNDGRDHTDALDIRSGFFCFDSPPKAGDVLLDRADRGGPGVRRRPALRVPHRRRRRRPQLPAAGVGGLDGEGWVACELESRHDRRPEPRRRRDRCTCRAATPRRSSTRSRAGWLRAHVTERRRGPAAVQRVARDPAG